MANPSPNRRITVCLFSTHPLLPAEFERTLPEQQFRLLIRRVDPEMGSEADLEVPKASVYVLEAQRLGRVTEALAGRILSTQPTARLLVIFEKLTEENAFPLLRLGTKGLLTFSDVEEQLPRAVRVIAEAGFWVPRDLLSRFVESTLSSVRRPRDLPRLRRISKREREVLDLLLQNLSNKEIAAQLNISSRTAKFHVSNLLAKHGVRRRADLILLVLTPLGA